MRLIDANQLILCLSNYALLESPSGVESADDRKVSRAVCQAIKECVRAVDERPTAFDADKVVEQLDKASDYYEFDEQGKEYVQMVNLIQAIEIVKGGGVE